MSSRKHANQQVHKRKRKPANVVMKYMQDFGYKVYPINPFAVGEVINGEVVCDSLASINDKIDIVDCSLLIANRDKPAAT